jgi:peptide/nickel transport system ATP-binding protein
MMPLLEVKDLEVAFEKDKKDITCIDKVSFSVSAGEILCIVGESGSGKSVTSLSILRLLSKNGKITGGSIYFNGESLVDKSEKEMDLIRGSQITMIFQDALSSLNPVFTIGSQLIESIAAHMGLNKKEARERAEELLRTVGLPDPSSILKKYPHTLSGGMRQRVMIAMALSCNPKLVIADEPTTALDVTIQAQIMDLLRRLNQELGMSIILITHDMGVVAEMADRVLVMYAGQIVEEALVENIFKEPEHPYTKALLQSIPSIKDYEERELIPIQGAVPEEYHEMSGCRFSNRCEYALSLCSKSQDMIMVSEDHYKRCWRTDLPDTSYRTDTLKKQED